MSRFDDLEMPLRIYALVQTANDDDGFALQPEVDHVRARAVLQIPIPIIDSFAEQFTGRDPLDGVENIGDVSVSLRRRPLLRRAPTDAL